MRRLLPANQVRQRRKCKQKILKRSDDLLRHVFFFPPSLSFSFFVTFSFFLTRLGADNVETHRAKLIAIFIRFIVFPMQHAL